MIMKYLMTEESAIDPNKKSDWREFIHKIDSCSTKQFRSKKAKKRRQNLC